MILLIDNKSDYFFALKKYLKNRSIRFVIAGRNSDLKTIMKHRYKGIILTGGPLQYDQKLFIENVSINFAVLLDLTVPILGICFGHQTIAEAFGGRVKRAKTRLKTIEKIRLVKRSALFKSIPSTFMVYKDHIDYIAKIPYNFELLARSVSCPVEAIKHKYRPIYGVQFHPAMSGELGYAILDNFIKICKIKIKKN